MHTLSPETLVELLVEQSERLLDTHDHLSRVIQGLRLPMGYCEDRSSQPQQAYEFEGMIRLFLYKEARGLSQEDAASIPLVYLRRFGLETGSLTQGCLSQTWNERFTDDLRAVITHTAEGIRTAALDHDVHAVDINEISNDNDEITEPPKFSETQIRQKTRLARKHGFTCFNTHRADNTTYSDTQIWEIVSHMAMADMGTGQGVRRHGRTLFRDETPHHSTVLRAVKAIATPDAQRTLTDFKTGRDKEWDRIRDRVVDQFSDSVGQILDRIKDFATFTEPVVAAIDITTWPFWPYPYEQDDEGNSVRDETGEKVIDDDYPDMVSGVSTDTEEAGYAYKFATLTIVENNVPIVLAIEPVKDDSPWDDGDTLHRHEVVGRLLDQAQKHVNIDLVYCDREFDGRKVGREISKRGVKYLIPKRKYATDYDNIGDIESHESADAAVLRDVERGTEDGDHTHTVSIIYTPSCEEEGNYAVFLASWDVPPDEIEVVTNRYSRRWIIEQAYKSQKKHFLPNTSSTDYRLRLAYFALSAVLYNVWRLTDYLLKGGFDKVDSDYEPVLTGGEFVELIGVFLRPIT